MRVFAYILFYVCVAIVILPCMEYDLIKKWIRE